MPAYAYFITHGCQVFGYAALSVTYPLFLKEAAKVTVIEVLFYLIKSAKIFAKNRIPEWIAIGRTINSINNSTIRNRSNLYSNA